jgi:hypothetical protein
MNFFYVFLFQRTEVPRLIADGSGLFVDLARMVQGSSYSLIVTRSQISTFEALFST